MPNLPFKIANAPQMGGGVSAAVYGGGAGLSQVGEALQRAGQIVQVTQDRLFEAEQDSLYFKTMTDESLRLRQRVSEIQQGDFHEAEAAFDKEAELSVKAGKGLAGPRAEQFRNQMAEVIAQERTKITGWVNGKQLDATRANRDIAMNQMQELAARAKSPGERDLWRQNALGLLESTVLGGATDAQEAVRIAEQFEKGVAIADYREGLNTNPQATLIALTDENSALSRMLDEGTRQQAIAQATSAVEQQINDQYTSVVRANNLANIAEKAASDEAEERLNTLMFNNGSVSHEEIAAEWGRLSGPAQRRWTDVKLNGGKRKDGASDNPTVYLGLSESMESGDNIEDAANEAYLGGSLTKATRDTLIRQSREKRFGDARTFIRESLSQSQFDFEKTMPQREAEALKAFDEWTMRSDEVTRDDAFQRARQLVESARIAQGAVTPVPIHSVFAGGVLDVRQTQANIFAEYLSENPMASPEKMRSDPILMEQLRWLKIHSDAQEQRRRTQAAAGASQP